MTPADVKTLRRYHKILAENRAFRVRLAGEQAVRAEEERESRLTEAERDVELDRLLRLLD